MFRDLNLDKRLLRALDDLGYTTPTLIQEKVFSVAMSGVDLCGIAQTGTGKTLAYLLPLLNQWKYDKAREPQILVLVPTRELVVQVVDVARSLSAHLGATITGVYGGVNINTQRLQFAEGADVLVATPGRFYDLAVTGAFKVRSIKKLVIDEVDEMLNLGFRAQLRNIPDLLPQRRQNLLFSATMIPEVEAFMQEYFPDPTRVEAAPAGTPVAGITQSAYAVPNFHTKVNLLRLLLKDEAFRKVLVFTASKAQADELFGMLAEDTEGGMGLIHSNKEQNHRINTVRQFRDGSLRVLVATDIVARGIDVTGVSHVINFDLPDEPASYIHRIGRTGRADQRGNAISLVLQKDAATVEAIEALMGMQLPFAELPEALEISTVLTADELPTVYMKDTPPPKKREEGGAAFHERSAKRQKVNVRVSRREQMQQKYGKPIKRGAKKKKR
ncbi:MAG: DEAD/DEAH box helicase [Chitinophagaceae bacterium]|nr:MAG: DEAD/DEAH box helicase [Chitinophagaceae bacterium]